MQQPFEIIIAEDNPRDRKFLQDSLEGHELQVAENGQEALDLINGKQVLNIVCDIQMPLINGIDLARRVWKQIPDAKIIFWSQFRDEVYLRSLKKIIPPQTVYGYVLKSNTSEVLQQAVQTVFEFDQCWIDPKVRSIEARLPGTGDIINDAEFEVLVDIALGLTDNMIAERRFLTRRGVQSRLKLLYQKLGADRATVKDDFGDAFNSRSRAISIALNRGLINAHELKKAENSLQSWLSNERDRNQLDS